MVLLVALVMLLLITMIGISSMQNATLQEKMAGSVQMRNTTFQAAEAALRVGENAVAATGYTLVQCTTSLTCSPPPATEYNNVTAAGTTGTSGIAWVAVGTTGFYGVQFLGIPAAGTIPNTTSSSSLYRITAIGFTAATPLTNPRTVLESVYGK
ncbi:type IV pilus assembly protein PilX [Pseudomonas sp. M47T1]|uniref:pilus assembly PilX family protein n=1 Tax=unclassified Pseudomonas TaxID=196821 RepID=UPI0002606BF4|nr:PilX N-terminal domain-containing pilus assembly protein [Pseudomonas sp. M47T1]EIK95189.1 type IV pilus assembly protein PilX [Pseudomonas sp. M47T1]